jgi:hypothetical protein
MGWNIFKSSKNKEISLQERIDIALQKAKEDKRKASKEISDIREWAAEAIIDVYIAFFPNGNLTYYRKQYAETALAKYDEIKQKYAGQIDAEMVEKCDNLVSGYLNQIQLRESKLKLFEKIEAEYVQTKEKLKMAEAQGKKTDRIQEHTERLEKLDEDTEGLSNAMVQTNNLDDVKKEIELKEEYFNQLEKLNIQFANESDYKNSLSYKEEIDKMINNMDDSK